MDAYRVRAVNGIDRRQAQNITAPITVPVPGDIIAVVIGIAPGYLAVACNKPVTTAELGG
jgi:hypothetical protein